MVYKTGTVDDLSAVPIHDENAKSILFRYATILTENYARENDVMTQMTVTLPECLPSFRGALQFV